ncbi:MAG TPA: hypothetical protein VFP33_11420 [Gallionella sp.]|nr:hypothetical protein [Gallionella sp.]
MLRLFFCFLLMFSFQSLGAGMPSEIKKIQEAVASIPGITDARVGKTDVSEIREGDFSLLPYGDLPLGALKRTKGGLDNELVVAINFGITPDTQGLRALEFISWWVRDEARSGTPIQVRSLALPPIATQFGETLRFSIDYFYSDPKREISVLLMRLGGLADSLNSSKDIYPNAVSHSSKNRADEARWMFKEPQDTEVLVSRSATSKGEAILYAVHDDAEWIFLGEEKAKNDGLEIVSLLEATRFDPSILMLADLESGWIAKRDSASSGWVRKKLEGDILRQVEERVMNASRVSLK